MEMNLFLGSMLVFLCVLILALIYVRAQKELEAKKEKWKEYWTYDRRLAAGHTEEKCAVCLKRYWRAGKFGNSICSQCISERHSKPQTPGQSFVPMKIQQRVTYKANYR